MPAAGKLPWYTLVVGLALLVAFGLLSWFMLDKGATLPANAQHVWDRMLLIFNAVQTMAAAAVGVLLGTSVQQARVASAERRAEEKEYDAAKAQAARKLINGLQPPGALADDRLNALAEVLR